MNLKTLILCGATALLTAGSSFAGPLARLVHRPHRGCQSIPAIAAPPVTEPAPVVVQTSYQPPAVGADAVAYQTIRLTSPLPVFPLGGCVGGQCGR